MQSSCMQSFTILLEMRDRRSNTKGKSYDQGSPAGLGTIIEPGILVLEFFMIFCI